ncbi:MAG: glutathione S-transferase family protein [Gammaproteobacteria bacterium]
MYTVYGMGVSGNCYKVKLLLEQLGEKYAWREIDSLHGGTRTPEFLTINPNGKVPVLEYQPGEYLPESIAILCYLADGTRFWPRDRLASAQTMQWMFFEQYSHEPYVAVARMVRAFLPQDHPRRAELPRLLERGNQALNVMERRLSGNRFFVADRYSIADIALYAYTHCAADGGFDLGKYPAVTRWLNLVQSQPGHVPMA